MNISTPTAYYNEIDPYAAQWLRNLILAGHIAPGDVDERSIEDVRPDEIKNYTQCHFFAGIGVWSYALRRAGWGDDRPVWTGSCPCQPFSVGGQGRGFADERHLWPSFFHLIEQCKPIVIFGEQVASKDGLTWLDLVQSDMEGEGYTFGATDICAAGFGAPHMRQRLYWVGDTQHYGLPTAALLRSNGKASSQRWQKKSDVPKQLTRTGTPRDGTGLHGCASTHGEQHRIEQQDTTGSENALKWLADIHDTRPQRVVGKGFQSTKRKSNRHVSGSGELVELRQHNSTNGLWQNVDWIKCRDGRWRPIEPGTFPLVDGVTNRVGQLRAYGNAINEAQAEEFIKAYMECEPTTGEDLV